MSALLISKEQFYSRLKRFYTRWEEDTSDEDLQKIDAFICVAGVDEGNTYGKAAGLQQWLFGVEVTDTLLAFCKNGVFILSSKKKIDVLRQLENAKENIEGVPPVTLLVRDKNDKDKANFAKIIGKLKSSGQGTCVGEFAKEKASGEFVTAWQKVLNEANFEMIDVSHSIAMIMAPKDEEEQRLVKAACETTCAIFQKYLRKEIIDIVDEDRKKRHSKISEDCEEAIKNKKYYTDLLAKKEFKDFDVEQLEVCYSPWIQSGGNYNLKFSATSDKNQLHFGTIVCSLGLRYRSYCSNICRTVLVDPPKPLQDVYSLLLETEEKIMDTLRPGVELCEVYNMAVEYVKSKRPELVDKMIKSLGFVTGSEFRVSSMVINSKNTTKVEKDFVLIISVGFSDIENPSAKDDAGKTVALYVGDTVIVKEDGPAENLTENAKNRVKSVCLFFKSEEEQQEEPKEQEDVLSTAMSKRKSVLLQDQLRKKQTMEDKRKEHQKELADQLNREARDRIARAQQAAPDQKIRKSNVSYKNASQLPQEPEVKELKIFVDKKYETLVMPVFGVQVPFHISSIRNVSQSVEGDFTYLRINFFHPGATIGKTEVFPKPEATFLKELTYRSTNVKEPGELSAPSSNLTTACRLIKDIQKKFKTREAEEREKEGIVKQDKLVLSQNKANPRLKDLYIRPNILQKRITGSLEAHINGFRYTSIRGDKVDIMYNNIKHAFFQPCDHEMIILLHFHLKHAILFGKKKHIDIQFFTEVGEITTDLGKHQHMHDRDDLYAEQAERELRSKLNSAFRAFCEKVEKLTNQELEFDTPFRELGFHGVPHRSSVLLQPTSVCIVNLTEWPPFVITLEEIELVHFERVSLQLKNFDMVFIFKDYNKKPATISSVPMNMLDHVKEWLDSCDIRYTEGLQSLNWPKIMKTIVDDPDGFFEQGGWNFLSQSDNEEGEDAEDEDSEDDEAFKPSDDDEEEEEESDEEYESEVSEDDDDDDESASEELSSGEESGKSWSELEEEAKRADNDKGEFEIQDDRDRNRKRKPVGKAPAKKPPPAKKPRR